jgi:hypothetical protein
VGTAVGATVGVVEGAAVGSVDGALLGDAVGALLGAAEGEAEGEKVGTADGDHVSPARVGVRVLRASEGASVWSSRRLPRTAAACCCCCCGLPQLVHSGCTLSCAKLSESGAIWWSTRHGRFCRYRLVQLCSFQSNLATYPFTDTRTDVNGNILSVVGELISNSQYTVSILRYTIKGFEDVYTLSINF